ncbi:glycosyltransferase [Aeromonas hydrophila]|uniref:glycosyltransferase n=1 Tax=Aeromonas hydrophila TaxID=644 RepID=UPI00259F99D5|nr:glycosyltransferase [Aeromonas hydrophila]MDM5119739.1 glycosyltransferase [Aeromonas hydrophila]
MIKRDEMKGPKHKIAPVVIFTYNRLTHLSKTIDALRKNTLASETELYIFSDAAKDDGAIEAVEKLRSYVDSIDGFKSVHRCYRTHNYGALKNIMDGQYEVIEKHGVAIVMEDDNVTSKNFLEFMNQGLIFYKDNPKVYSICGYCPPSVSGLNETVDVWAYPWNISWGYAFWKNKYDKIHPLINNYDNMKRTGVIKKIRNMGGLYITDSLYRDRIKSASFPDAILCAEMTNHGMYSILPSVSKVINIGSDGSGNSKGVFTNKYDVVLDDGSRSIFDFNHDPVIDKEHTIFTTRFYNGKCMTILARYLGIYHLWIKFKVLFRH